jgi:hypothetical protein
MQHVCRTIRTNRCKNKEENGLCKKYCFMEMKKTTKKSAFDFNTLYTRFLKA